MTPAPHTDVPSRRVHDLLGCPVDVTTMEQTVRRCREWWAGPRQSQVLLTVNASFLVAMEDDASLRDAARESDWTVADGMAVVWASRWLRKALPERVAGVDLMQELLGAASEEQRRVFFLGAKEEVLRDLRSVVEERYPGVIIAGMRNGYFGDDESSQIVELVRESKADVLFVGMPSPFKERWCQANRSRLATPVLLGVGGSFDVVAGHIRRAPLRIQRLGLEWFWRFLQEPRRLWKRYLVTNSLFLMLLLRARPGRRGPSANR